MRNSIGDIEIRFLEERIREKRAQLEEEENALKIIKRLMGITAEDNLPCTALLKNNDNQNFDDLFEAGVGEKRFLIDDIRDLIPRFGTKDFTVTIVHRALLKAGVEMEAKQPKARIASALKKLVDEGSLQLVFKGSGNRPAIFKAKDEEAEKEKTDDGSDLI